MSDEIRSEDEVEAHSGPFIENPIVDNPLVEATEDDEADFEAHGVLVENAKNAKNAK